MRKTTKREAVQPKCRQESGEVLRFSSADDFRSQLDVIARQGAQQMLQAALEAEVKDFLAEHRDRRDAAGRRLVVRNGYLPPREIVTGAGPLEIRQPRPRDKSSASEGRAEFVPKIIPAYLRRSKSIEEFIPWLYLKGISTGDFPEVMRSEDVYHQSVPRWCLAKDGPTPRPPL